MTIFCKILEFKKSIIFIVVLKSLDDIPPFIKKIFFLLICINDFKKDFLEKFCQ